MRYILTLLLVFAMATPCMAGGCQDTQDAAHQALKARNGRVTDTHNVLIPDPEEDRGWLFDILGSISVYGDSFSLGVSLPSLQQMLQSACGTVSHKIQSKIREAQNDALNSVPTIGGYNPLTVNGSTDFITPLSRKLK